MTCQILVFGASFIIAFLVAYNYQIRRKCDDALALAEQWKEIAEWFEKVANESLDNDLH
jgi:hypothetical protein